MEKRKQCSNEIEDSMSWVKDQQSTKRKKFMLDDHSEVAPRLSIPNRTVKHFSADDSAQLPGVKVGHRQAINILLKSLLVYSKGDFFKLILCFCMA